jgi:PhnB protein
MPETDLIGLTPYLVVSDAAAASDFYQRAFGATEIARHATPDGKKLMHVRIQLFGSTLYFADDFPEMMGGTSRTPEALGGSPVTLHVQVPDATAVWEQAVAAGATVTMPLKDQFWGDRYGQLRDPFGHAWSIGQTLRQVSPEEFEKAARKEFKPVAEPTPA